MKIERESRVIITLTNVEGLVVEKLDNEVLVKHKAEIDGVTKTITQWYDLGVIKPVEEELELSDSKVNLELGVIPEEPKKFHKGKK